MDMDEAATKRDEALRSLQREVDDEERRQNAVHPFRGDCPRSPPAPGEDPPPYPTARCRFFDRHGFAFLPSFASDDEVRSMKRSMAEAVEREWDPSSRGSAQVFRTDDGQADAQARSDYFLDSATRCHFFAEKDAADESGALRKEYRDDKMTALNKAGHGMHTRPGPFMDYARSGKVASLLRELGWVDPVVPQSMYIFKQARIGGEVTSHQDSTFLYTTPMQTCIGLWLALDDATLENGCLWVRPGSHMESVRRQFVRNPKHFGKSLNYEGEGGDASEPQMIFTRLSDSYGKVTWEGALPDDLGKAGFIPVPCKAGDLLAFVGELDHLSLPNLSSKARHTFQLHCIEGEGAGVTWSRENWLQYPPGVPFMKL
ncbi:hypothetical protein ACHAWF_007662 [Thalassiosira exigua]